MMVMMKGSFDSNLKFKKSSLPDTTNNTKWSKYSTQSKLKLNVHEGENLYWANQKWEVQTKMSAEMKNCKS